MTRYCCPECGDHPILNNLECIFCEGRYVWKEKCVIHESEINSPQKEMTSNRDSTKVSK